MSKDTKYTWESITIKPNDQRLVGEVVKNDYFKSKGILLDVGLRFATVSVDSYPESFPIDNNNWLICQEVKKEI